jgi:hypothetical protein
MIAFFKDVHYRHAFYKGIPICIVLAVFVVARALGRRGHMDETAIYFLFGVIIFCLLVMMWILNYHYKNNLRRRTK